MMIQDFSVIVLLKPALCRGVSFATIGLQFWQSAMRPGSA
jgi:hypothetical protein